MRAFVALQQRRLGDIRVARRAGDLGPKLRGLGADDGVVDDGADRETEGGADLGHRLEDGTTEGLFVWETDFSDEKGASCDRRAGDEIRR